MEAQLLDNYRALVRRADDHVRAVLTRYGRYITCRKGCDACCRFLTLFPVEAVALSAAFVELDPESRALIETACAQDTACPLLHHHECLLYAARPLICRTHGLPICFKEQDSLKVDFCPENFKGLATLPGDALLDLDQLNTTLAAVNTLFLDSIDADLPDRIPISQALFLLET